MESRGGGWLVREACRKVSFKLWFKGGGWGDTEPPYKAGGTQRTKKRKADTEAEKPGRG